MKPSHWGGRARERVRYRSGKEEGKEDVAGKHLGGKMDHHAEEGGLEQGEAGKKWICSVKDQALFFPCHAWEVKEKERRNYFRWVLTESYLLLWRVRGKKCFMGVLSYLWGNSKDDANHLWVTSYIHHPCYSFNVHHRPSSNSSHAHFECRSIQYRQCFTVGGSFLNFIWGRHKTFYCSRYTVWSSHLWLNSDRLWRVCWLTDPKFNFVSLSLVLCLKTICGDIKIYTHLMDSPAYTWWLATAHCLDLCFRLPVKADYQCQ